MIEAHIIQENGNFVFDIRSDCDILQIDGEPVAESLFTSEPYAREATAERNATKWIKEFRDSGEAKRRRLCGFDPVGACAVTRPSVPVLRRRAGTR